MLNAITLRRGLILGGFGLLLVFGTLLMSGIDYKLAGEEAGENPQPTPILNALLDVGMVAVVLGVAGAVVALIVRAVKVAHGRHERTPGGRQLVGQQADADWKSADRSGDLLRDSGRRERPDRDLGNLNS